MKKAFRENILGEREQRITVMEWKSTVTRDIISGPDIHPVPAATSGESSPVRRRPSNPVRPGREQQ